MKTDDPHIRRRADGSIDLDRYDRIARTHRAREQRAAFIWLIAPVMWVLPLRLERRNSR
jgi:hypothetical protein